MSLIYRETRQTKKGMKGRTKTRPIKD